MSSTTEEYTLTWNDYGRNISISFNEILDRKELIDVTLVADGYLVNAHRLILSAISPYFLEMFNSIPANHQAIVFLRDISKRTLNDLITFIYSGEVSVNQKNVNEFLDGAKKFKIKGLMVDDTDDKESRRSSTISHGSQHQSTQTVPVRIQDQNKGKNYNSVSSINQQHPALDESEVENLNEIDQFEYETPIEMAECFAGSDMNGDDEPMDQQHFEQDDEWNTHQNNDIEIVPKRHKTLARVVGVNAYNTEADIRLNEYGRLNLYYDGFKFHRNGNKCALKQNWQCTRHNKQCRASASTMDIDGVTMVKISIAEHSHDP